MMLCSWRKGSAVFGGALALALLMPTAANAQVDARLERIESQMRALQRVVFPGGDERYFEPEITAQNAANSRQNAPSSSAVTDILVRLDALETQIARLTAATEVNENALSALERRLVALEARPAASAPAITAAPTGVINVPSSSQPANQVAVDTGPSPERLQGVQAITKPATGDAGDDEYTYGFRLWDAGFYPEAQQQLSLFVEQYPSHWRTTYGRNLLGRAFLDAGEPRRAATHFFDNYQSDKQAARASDSLLFLAESMIALDDMRRACIALAEFGEIYPALAAGRLQSQYEGLKGRVDCDG